MQPFALRRPSSGATPPDGLAFPRGTHPTPHTAPSAIFGCAGGGALPRAAAAANESTAPKSAAAHATLPSGRSLRAARFDPCPHCLPVGLHGAVQQLFQVYSSELCRRMDVVCPPPPCVAGVCPSPARRMFELSEAYRLAVVPLGETTATSMWALISYLLCCWEEGSDAGSPTSALNISPTLQRWYREYAVHFDILHEHLSAFDPRAAAETCARWRRQEEEREALRLMTSGRDAPISPEDALAEKYAATLDEVTFLTEALLRLCFCGAFELAAMLLERLLFFFQYYDGMAAAHRGPVGGGGAESFLSEEIESCCAAVKHLLLLPVKTPSGDALEAETGWCVAAQPGVGGSARQVPPVPTSFPATDPIGRGTGVAYFRTPAEHQAWQQEANRLVYTAKRVLGDGAERGRGEEEVAGGGGSPQHLFRQFALAALDIVLMFSGDARLVEEVALESGTSLMGYLVGFSCLCEPFMNMAGLAERLDQCLSSPMWGEGRSPESSDGGGWQYRLLLRLLQCRDVGDIPAALRCAFEMDAQRWPWNPADAASAVAPDPVSFPSSEEDDDEQEEDYDSTTAAPLPPALVRRFVITAMCGFLSDAITLPQALLHGATPAAALLPENLVHRYVLLDHFLELLVCPREGEGAAPHAPAATRGWLWPIRLGLRLSSPLSDPAQVAAEVERVGRSELWWPTAADAYALETTTYQRLMGMMCGSLGAATVRCSWHSSSAVQRFTCLVLQYAADHAEGVEGTAGAGLATYATAAPQEDGVEAVDSYAMSFRRSALQWRCRMEEVRQASIAALHEDLTKAALDLYSTALHGQAPQPAAMPVPRRLTFSAAPLTIAAWLSDRYSVSAARYAHLLPAVGTQGACRWPRTPSPLALFTAALRLVLQSPTLLDAAAERDAVLSLGGAACSQFLRQPAGDVGPRDVRETVATVAALRCVICRAEALESNTPQHAAADHIDLAERICGLFDAVWCRPCCTVARDPLAERPAPAAPHPIGFNGARASRLHPRVAHQLLLRGLRALQVAVLHRGQSGVPPAERARANCVMANLCRAMHICQLQSPAPAPLASAMNLQLFRCATAP